MKFVSPLRRMARENPNWGQARVAAELALKLGIWVSLRTVRAYWPPQLERRGGRRIAALEKFCAQSCSVDPGLRFSGGSYGRISHTLRFRRLGVGNSADRASQRNGASYGEWTLRQFREAVPGDHMYRFVVHDRDAIYSAELDQAVEAMGGVLPDGRDALRRRDVVSGLPPSAPTAVNPGKAMPLARN